MFIFRYLRIMIVSAFKSVPYLALLLMFTLIACNDQKKNGTQNSNTLSTEDVTLCRSIRLPEPVVWDKTPSRASLGNMSRNDAIATLYEYITKQQLKTAEAEKQNLDRYQKVLDRCVPE